MAETPAGAAPAPGFRTRGQPVAVAAVAAMLAAGVPHAILLTGPSGVGKGVLADDLAAGLLCRSAPAARPCRSCRGCRAAEHGNHPDLHRLDPVGAGSVIPIGGREERGVRDLVRELALLPVEGGARVAIIRDADRMTEDAQSAFLKSLEEPPPGTVLILTAQDEERLLPTIRSRCVRVRVGPVGRSDIEAILLERGLADAPTAARLARLAAGRPAEAITLARTPDAIRLRGEVGRRLLDLAAASRADRLRLGRELLAAAGEIVAATRAAAVEPNGDARPVAARTRRTRTASQSGDAAGTTTARIPAAERRGAALALIGIWRDIARDLALVQLDRRADVRQLDLLDDLEATAAALPPSFPEAQLRALDVAGERLEGNVSPELVVDGLVIGWTA